MSMSLARHTRRFPRWRHIVSLLALAPPAMSLTCADSTPTDTQESLTTVPTAALSVSSAPASADDSTIRIQGTIPLPINQSYAGMGPVFRISHSGGGANGQFLIDNSASGAAALLGQSSGAGYAVRGVMTGSGRAGFFVATSTANASHALESSTAGTGAAVAGTTTGTGPAASFTVSNVNHASSAVAVSSNSQHYGSTALRVVTSGGAAAYFENNVLDNVLVNALEVNARFTGAAGVFRVGGGSWNNRSAIEATSDNYGPTAVFRQLRAGTAPGIDVSTVGAAPAAVFTVTNSIINTSGAIDVTTNADNGWAAIFTSTGAGGGVQITTNGGPGLQVTGGTKNAVVRTSNGARALYTEESTEVWFTDYAFGRLTSGRVHVVIDPTFAETVNLTEPYHVFVQSYGDAELIVSNRTASGFDVILREGEQRDAEFSYRLVAKRLGFETERLKRAPWADNTMEKLPARIP